MRAAWWSSWRITPSHVGECVWSLPRRHHEACKCPGAWGEWVKAGGRAQVQKPVGCTGALVKGKPQSTSPTPAHRPQALERQAQFREPRGGQDPQEALAQPSVPTALHLPSNPTVACEGGEQGGCCPRAWGSDATKRSGTCLPALALGGTTREEL